MKKYNWFSIKGNAIDWLIMRKILLTEYTKVNFRKIKEDKLESLSEDSKARQDHLNENY